MDEKYTLTSNEPYEVVKQRRDNLELSPLFDLLDPLTMAVVFRALTAGARQMQELQANDVEPDNQDYYDYADRFRIEGYKNCGVEDFDSYIAKAGELLG